MLLRPIGGPEDHRPRGGSGERGFAVRGGRRGRIACDFCVVVEPAASGSKSPPTPAGKVCGLLLGDESPFVG
jgi:hypothetical protein